MSSIKSEDQCRLSHPSKRAERVKRVREMSGLSREALKKTHNISRGTLQNWESARFGGLTLKGAKIISKIFSSEGIQVSIEWLMHGIGQEPKYFKHQNIHQSENLYYLKLIPEREQKQISQELIFLRNRYRDVQDIVVNDNSMSPYYKEGDFVIGIKLYQEDIKNALWKNCIIQTYEYGIVVKYLRPGNSSNKYDLWSHNIQSSSKNIAFHNIEIISAAPVIWLRRPFTIQTKFIQNRENQLITA